MKNIKDPNKFVHDISQWYQENKRDLPFRKTQDPYHIWISEIMAQQTQMDSLIPYYQRFIKRFPNVAVLADADISEVLSLWEGLGYYRRAHHIHESAQIIKRDFNGVFPSTLKDIKALKGVGDYTAAAIHAIAYDQPSVAIDGNVMRVMSRILLYDEDIRKTTAKRAVTQILEPLIKLAEPSVFTQALMELGALVCKKIPDCEACPMQNHCFAYKQNNVMAYPKISKLKPKTLETYITFVLYHRHHYLLITRPKDGLLGGLLAFPQYQTHDFDRAYQKFKADFKLPDFKFESLGIMRHVFTHKIWVMQVYACEITKPLEAMVNFETKTNAISTAHKKIFSLIKSK